MGDWMSEVTTPSRRKDLFQAYLDNITDYICAAHPEAPHDEVYSFVKEQINRRINLLKYNLEDAQKRGLDLTQPRQGNEMLWPTAQLMRCYNNKLTEQNDPMQAPFYMCNDPSTYHSYGNATEFETYDLYEFLDFTASKIMCPFGSVYETTDIQTSFLKGMIDGQSKARKVEKKAMLNAKRIGDSTAATFHNNNQATIKINMNSMPGGMGSGHCFLSSVANFNSVTSTARFFIMNSYAHTERFLEANFFFRTEEQLLNHIVTCMQRCPDVKKIVEVCNNTGIRLPDWEEVYDFLVKCLHRYNFAQDHPNIRVMLCGMHPGQLAFLFYMSNLNHIFRCNESIFRPYIDSFFDIPVEADDSAYSPEDVRKLDGDMVTAMSVIWNDLLPKNKKGNSESVYDCVEQYPDIARKFARIGTEFAKKLKWFEEAFDLFINHRVRIGYVIEHKNMFRDSVILSDTDSIIFTSKSWIKWYTGDLRLTPAAYNITALIVYWLTKATAMMLRHLSFSCKIMGNDLKTMNMKNEFMFPVEILTSLKKHYVSLQKIQEGVVFGKLGLDIKGVNLRGSNFSNKTLSYVEWFAQGLAEDVYNHGAIDLKEKIIDVMRFERLVYDSLMNGQTTFLTVDPVKEENEYSDAERTLFFNYKMWEAVFASKYGSIVIPTKCFVVPLVGIRNKEYLDWLHNTEPDIEKALLVWFEKYPNRPLNRIPVNPLLDKVPDELIKVMDIRHIVYDNAKPLYLLLKSFGFVPGTSKKSPTLYSDMYGWVTSEEAQKVFCHTEKEG